MSGLDELFAAAKRAGIGVLVINNLQIGDVITAEQVAGGDISNSTDNSLTMPRVPPYLHSGSSAAALGESGPCVPLKASLHGTLYQWRMDEIDEAHMKFMRDYARQCDEYWRNR